jgi:hypothetical protein
LTSPAGSSVERDGLYPNRLVEGIVPLPPLPEQPSFNSTSDLPTRAIPVLHPSTEAGQEVGLNSGMSLLDEQPEKPRPLTYEDFVDTEWNEVRRALQVEVEEPVHHPKKMTIPAGKVWRNQATNYFPPEAKGTSQQAVVRIIQGHQKQIGMRRHPETI